MDRAAVDLAVRVASALQLDAGRVRAVLALREGGATIPFIARYRKEQTGGLDEVQLRAIDERRDYHRDLEERRDTVLRTIAGQGKLTAELRAAIVGATTKSVLEDLYLPFKPKRRTRASAARERGLLPLAEKIVAQPPTGDPLRDARAFVHPAKEVGDEKAALAGARDIVAEMFAEDPKTRARVRARFDREAIVTSARVAAKTKSPTKFEAYYEFEERAKTIPSHRFLAILRGEAEGVLRVKLRVDEDALSRELLGLANVRSRSPYAAELEEAVRDATKRLLLPAIEGDVRAELKSRSDQGAIDVFAENVKRLLLAPPLGRRVVIGIDPGQRTGCKCVVVDDTGKLLGHALLQLVQGKAALADAERTLAKLLATHRPFAIAVGNGTHGRETVDFCRGVVRAQAGDLTNTLVVPVSEAGASVYSASDVAREEFPDLDLTVRGAISIARRLQDPLAELVKIDPKAIGVGQYQHDVEPRALQKKLDDVVESCVNAVGVELNTASAPLLARVSGLGPSLAKKVVAFREKAGAFRTRKDLLKVAGIGPKAFEQAAGFVRIRDGAHPLDASAVHPERYELVESIASRAGVSLRALVGNEALARTIPWASYASTEIGLPTLEDIREEVTRPGRDPRDSFQPPEFRDDVRSIEDVAPGMVLEGVVTNVTAFGAFVDIGVHQDGLVHISQLADRFVRDPHTVVRVGDLVKARVLQVDVQRKRIALSFLLEGPSG